MERDARVVPLSLSLFLPFHCAFTHVFKISKVFSCLKEDESFIGGYVEL